MEVVLVGVEVVVRLSSWQFLDCQETTEKHLHHWDSKKARWYDTASHRIVSLAGRALLRHVPIQHDWDPCLCTPQEPET